MRAHIHLLCLATTFWTYFYLGGLWSNYYQTWPWLLSLVLIVLLPTAVLSARGPTLVNGLLRDKPPIRAAALVAAYFTIPLFLYDVLVLGIHAGLGWTFLISHWYLSVFYIIPWLLTPVMARKPSATGT